jgi:hypothetical protein
VRAGPTVGGSSGRSFGSPSLVDSTNQAATSRPQSAAITRPQSASSPPRIHVLSRFPLHGLLSICTPGALMATAVGLKWGNGGRTEVGRQRAGREQLVVSWTAGGCATADPRRWRRRSDFSWAAASRTVTAGRLVDGYCTASTEAAQPRYVLIFSERATYHRARLLLISKVSTLLCTYWPRLAYCFLPFKSMSCIAGYTFICFQAH